MPDLTARELEILLTSDIRPGHYHGGVTLGGLVEEFNRVRGEMVPAGPKVTKRMLSDARKRGGVTKGYRAR